MNKVSKIGAGLALTALALTGCSADSSEEKPASVATEKKAEDERPTQCADAGQVYGDVVATELQHNPERGWSCKIEISPDADVRSIYNPPADLNETTGITALEYMDAQDRFMDMIVSILNANEGTESATDPTQSEEWWATDGSHFFEEGVKEQVTKVGGAHYFASTELTPPSIYDAKSKYTSVKLTFEEPKRIWAEGEEGVTNGYLEFGAVAEYTKRVPSQEVFDEWSAEPRQDDETFRRNDNGELKVSTNEETGELEAEGMIRLVFDIPAYTPLSDPSWFRGMQFKTAI